MKKKDLAIDLLEMALARRTDPTVLATTLMALDRLSTRKPGHATAHYAAGRILLVMGQNQLAMGAFRTACARDPALALAHYYEGVSHWLLGDEQEALTKLARARVAEPELMPAFFDAGVIHYKRRDFRGALRMWGRALRLAPDDFGVLRKVLQAQIALGQWAHARHTHARVRAVWLESEDPAVRDLASYVFDQFDIGDLRVLAVESFEPSGNPAVKYSFAVSYAARVVMSATLETSEALRDAGFAWIVAIHTDDERVITDLRYTALPGYHLLRPAIQATIRGYTGAGGE
ncbi:MAG: tetratricopeptide (TPR) repeat protein [Myxococcota bacterium]|jgi:tetratricopeptide (TPR) repeat protein